MSKDTYCDALFNEVYTNPNGNYRFCCHAKPVPEEHKMNSRQHTPFEWFKSDYMEQVRTDVFDGIKNPACERCWKMEDAGGESFRTMRYNQHSYSDISNVKLNLALSNACNLSCYMCGPENSTTKHKEMVDIFGKKSRQAGSILNPGFALKRKGYQKLKENILDKTLFENVLKEIQLAESSFKITKKKNKNTTEELLANTYSEIYKKNNISELDFFTSLNFYSENPKELEEVYSNVLELLISERPITDQK